MKLYVDDVRPAPDGWTIARTVVEAKAFLQQGDVTEVSLDHDMGACDDCVASGKHVGDQRTPETTFVNWCKHVEDGCALAMWMMEANCVPPLVHVHSMNPVGRQRILAAFRARYFEA